MVILDLSWCNPMVPMSIESIRILPDDGSMILNNPIVIEDLPAPVLPTMPICREIDTRHQYVNRGNDVF